jgi:hypothetical protein
MSEGDGLHLLVKSPLEWDVVVLGLVWPLLAVVGHFSLFGAW